MNAKQKSKQFAERFKGQVHRAGTGSYYVRILDEFEFRFSDHHQVYAGAVASYPDTPYKDMVSITKKIIDDPQYRKSVRLSTRKQESDQVKQWKDGQLERIESLGGIEKVKSKLQHFKNLLAKKDPTGKRNYYTGSDRRSFTSQIRQLQEMITIFEKSKGEGK